MTKQTLTITDNRTGKSYELPIELGAIRAADLRQIKAGPDDFGLMSYDPAFMNTASCKSAITFIDGDRGILRYRGYPIEQIAERGSFLETAYLLLNGELPTRAELDRWTYNITHHRFLHENIKKFMDGFRYDAHPMGVFVSTVAGLSTFYSEAIQIKETQVRRRQIERLIAKTPTMAAFAYRHSVGMPYAMPDDELSYAGNFLNMMFRATEVQYRPNPVLERALDVLFMLHADHEQNCSTSAMRGVGSSEVDPYSAMAGAAAALYGPLHGGANEQVLRMLREIGSKKSIPDYIKRVKSKEVLLMGFGHRVYKNYDPRAKVIKAACDKVLPKLKRQDKLLDIARHLEEAALKDPYFIDRKLYPNVDFYSGLIYRALGIPTNMFTVMFAIGRLPGWLAHWKEMIEDPTSKISRPRQIYTGPTLTHYVPMEQRQ